MRLRSALTTTVCVLAAAFALPGPARAADGEFRYAFSAGGVQDEGRMIDPPSDVCLTLPEVADTTDTEPAFAPINNTSDPATVYTGPDCDGASFMLRPEGGHASERLKLRSVRFS